MRQGKWELVVLVDGTPLAEYQIEGRTVVAAPPGKEFTVEARYFGSEMHQTSLFIDEKSTTARKLIDGTATTTFAHTTNTFAGWNKFESGQVIQSPFVFESTATQEANSCEWCAEDNTDWSRNVITLRAYGGVREVIQHDAPEAGHAPDLRRAGAVSEKELIKGGFSSSAGAGSQKTFRAPFTWRAGMSQVGQLPGDPLQAEVTIYYRDNLFLARKGIEGLKWDETAGSSSSGSGLRPETAARQAKRPRNEKPVTIDLTGSDDEDADGYGGSGGVLLD